MPAHRPTRQSERVARELALLGISQLPSSGQLKGRNLVHLMSAAVQTLTDDLRAMLEEASSELERGHHRLTGSINQPIDTHLHGLESAREMVFEATKLAQSAINTLGIAVELPVFIQMANQQEVQAYAFQILETVSLHQVEIDAVLSQSLEGWQLSRLARIDQDILRIAVAEIKYLGLPPQVAINEAVELAKRYSADDGYKFINGVLRRVLKQFPALVEKP